MTRADSLDPCRVTHRGGASAECALAAGRSHAGVRPSTVRMAGRSGYPKSSGRVFRVLKISGFEK